MSFDGHSSHDTLVVEVPRESLTLQSIPSSGHSLPCDISRGGKKQIGKVQKAHMLSSTRTSEDTLLNGSRPKKLEKAKKVPRNGLKQSNQNKDKLCDRTSYILADQLSGGAKYVCPSDILQKFVTRQHTSSAQLGLSKMFNSESTLISITPDYQNTPSRQVSSTNSKMSAKYRSPGKVFCLDEVFALTQIEKLVERFGKVSHMGVLDSSYSLFLTDSRASGLLFKVYDGVAIVSGDLLCEWHQTEHVLAEFAAYRRKLSLDIVFLGATSEFVEFAKSRRWVTMQFGVEKVLNPMTNALLLETPGVAKRTISNSKQLLNKNVSLGIYIPKNGTDQFLQSQIMDVYNEWCSDRNNRSI